MLSPSSVGTRLGDLLLNLAEPPLELFAIASLTFFVAAIVAKNKPISSWSLLESSPKSSGLTSRFSGSPWSRRYPRMVSRVIARTFCIAAMHWCIVSWCSAASAACALYTGSSTPLPAASRASAAAFRCRAAASCLAAVVQLAGWGGSDGCGATALLHDIGRGGRGTISVSGPA